MMSCKDCPYYKDTDEIRKETTFVYDGNNYKFHLDDYTREFGYLLTRFHIITSIESTKKFIGIKQFFRRDSSRYQYPGKMLCCRF